MKKLLTFLPALALCVILSGCGSLGNINQIANTLGIGGRTYTFESLPQNLDQLKALPEASLTDPYAVAALTLAALTRYGESSRDCFEMLNYLKGPQPLSGYETSFIRERLEGKTYKPFSYFKGATPQNNYTPSRPYKVTIDSNQYSFIHQTSQEREHRAVVPQRHPVPERHPHARIRGSLELGFHRQRPEITETHIAVLPLLDKGGMCGKVVFGRVLENQIPLRHDQPGAEHFVRDGIQAFQRVGRIGEDNIEALGAQRDEIEYIVAHHLHYRTYAQRGGGALDERRVNRVHLDGDHFPGSAGGEFKGNAARAAEQVEDRQVLEIILVAEGIEKPFLGEIGRGPGLVAGWRVDGAPAQAAADDPHNSSTLAKCRNRSPLMVSPASP